MTRLVLAQRADSVSADDLTPLLRDPDGVIASADVLKEGDRSTVVRIDLGGTPVVLKRYNLKGPGHTASHLVLRSRAQWSWRSGHRLRAAGLATPEPLAVIEERTGPFRLRSFLVTAFVGGATLLDRVHGNPPDSEIARLADEFATIWRTLGTLRVGHDDTKATNFIVGDDGRLWLIDLDGMRFGLPGPMFDRARRNDYARFMRNWQDHPDAAAVFRDRIDTD